MPFNEPSHFVVFFLPFYYFKFFTASTQKEKYLILIIGLIIGILSNNLTMIVGVFLGALIGFRSYIFLIALILFFIFPFISNYIDLGYFTSRLNIDKNTDNLSVICFTILSMYRMKSLDPITFTSSRNPSTNLPGAWKLCTFAIK